MLKKTIKINPDLFNIGDKTRKNREKKSRPSVPVVVKPNSLKKELLKHENEILSGINIIELSTKLYEKGYNGIDIINLVENPKFLNIEICKRYELLIAYNKVRKEFRNEKILMIFILNFLFLEKNYNLENISFM